MLSAAQLSKLAENEMIPGRVIIQTNLREMLIDEVIANYYINEEEKKYNFIVDFLQKEFFTLSAKIKIYKEILKRLDLIKYQKLKASRDIDKLQKMMEVRNICAHGKIIHSNLTEVFIYSAKETANVEDIAEKFWKNIIPSVDRIHKEYFIK